jgi:uncharacterized membrane protein (UPF0127 family)/pSer/pThr/pTyr-binding forkhead associated (FHA) protein
VRGAAILLAGWLALGCGRGDEVETSAAWVSVREHRVAVEIADTPEKQRLGLGGRSSLDWDRGMLFAYPHPGFYTFWMKGMRFDIDIVWIFRDRIVEIAHRVPHPGGEQAGPEDRLPVYQPRQLADAVLEVPAGYAEARGWRIGDRVQMGGVRGTERSSLPPILPNRRGMEDQRSSMLFCPPLPPLRLGTSAAVVIGRQQSCDLSLREGNVSRKHAEVRFNGLEFAIRDLGSTNGTFVNGERVVGERALAPGDRIEISSSTVTFCQIEAGVDAPLAEPGEEKTILFERPPLKEAFHGELTEIPPFALLQVLELGTKSGMLEIESDEGRERIWLVDGAPVHAETEKQSGFDAALVIASRSKGQFRFEPGSAAAQQTMQASDTLVLLAACLLMDAGLN